MSLNLNAQLAQLAVTFVAGDERKAPFVFLHGNTQNDTCGIGLMQYFQQRGHTVLSYDLPGHGDSLLNDSDYEFSELIDLHHAVLKRFQIEKAILCGHSLGGMIQAGAICRYQLPCQSLILCGSYDGNPITSALHQGQAELAAELDQGLSDYLSQGFGLFKKQFKYDYFANREIDDGFMQIINRRYSHPQASFNNLRTMGDFSARESLQRLGIPVLVLHGEMEHTIPKPLILKMIEGYSQLRVEWYSQMDHCAFYQRPDMTEYFLNRHYDFIHPSKS